MDIRSPNILSTLNVTGGTVSANKVAQRLLEFSMVLETTNIENETEARILISSAKSINENILKRLCESKILEDLGSIRTEVEAEDKKLAEEDKRVKEGFEEIERLKKEKKKLEKKKIELGKRGEGLEKKIAEGRRQEEELSSALKKIELEHTENGKDYLEKKTRLEELQTKKKELEKEVREQKELMSRFVKDEFGLQNEIEAFQLQLEEYQEQNTVKKEENHALSTEHDSLSKRLKLLKAKLRGIETERERLENQNKLQKVAVEVILGTHDGLLSEVVEKQVNLQQLEQESRVLSQKEESARQRLREVDQRSFTAQRRGDKQKRELEELRETCRRQDATADRMDAKSSRLDWFLQELRAVSETCQNVLEVLQKILTARGNTAGARNIDIQGKEEYVEAKLGRRLSVGMKKRPKILSQEEVGEEPGPGKANGEKMELERGKVDFDNQLPKSMFMSQTFESNYETEEGLRFQRSGSTARPYIQSKFDKMNSGKRFELGGIILDFLYIGLST